MTISFLAPVANVDASIQKVSLKNGFEFIGLKQEEAINLLASLETTTPENWSRQFLGNPIINWEEKMAYFIKNSIPTLPAFEDQNWWKAHWNELAEFDNKQVNDYLLPTMRKLKLLARGNIEVTSWYYYEVKNNLPIRYMSRWGRSLPISKDVFHIEADALGDATRFLDSVQMPLSLPYLELAFENYELSYHAPNDGLAFLTLMICLETLFNPGEGEISYRIARNVAVALGENAEQSEKLYSNVRDHYKTRSEIVHSGKTDSLKRDDIADLRETCRMAIKRLVECKIDKETLMATLNKRSFGSPIQ